MILSLWVINSHFWRTINVQAIFLTCLNRATVWGSIWACVPFLFFKPNFQIWGLSDFFNAQNKLRSFSINFIVFMVFSYFSHHILVTTTTTSHGTRLLDSSGLSISYICGGKRFLQLHGGSSSNAVKNLHKNKESLVAFYSLIAQMCNCIVFNKPFWINYFNDHATVWILKTKMK